MSEEFWKVKGEVVSANDFSISKAEDFAKAIEKSDWTYLIGCRRTNSGDEIIIFDTDVEVGQKPTHDIRHHERIAVIFEKSNAIMPEVLALRKDFPLVPHVNLRPEEFPRSLCVVGQKYSEWKLRWTGQVFVENIGRWLAFTAEGKLHADDQPLEPLLVGSEGSLVLPSDFITTSAEFEPLFISVEDSGNGRKTYIAKRPTDSDENFNLLKYVAFSCLAKPQPHGVIRSAPATLFELHEFLENGSVNLLDELRSRLKVWRNEYKEAKWLERRLALIILLPKTRDENASTEELELRAFLTLETIKEVGIKIGLWDESDGCIGYLIPIDHDKKGEEIRVGMLNPVSSLSRERAAEFNGISSRNSEKIVAIGLGALGSQVFMTLIRAGYGEWTLVDEDFLLPHNLARHSLPGVCIGGAKSQWMAELANHTIDGNPIADWIVADILSSQESPETLEKLAESFTNAEIVLDASASVPVARHLVHDVDSPARRISIFLNPQGTDVVILAEDKEREITLDSLEMQYYRYLINKPYLKDHLLRDSERIRYATSCRDVSSTIPQDFVALQAAICSRAIRQVTSNKEAFMAMWRIDTDSINVQRHLFPVASPIKCQKGEWTLCTDRYLLDKVYAARVKKLPNETGGVLIGAYDMQRKIVYVVDYFLAPPDSEEWPTGFVRGYQGLNSRREEVKQITEGQLEYIGEWHSHPSGCDVNPSPEDRKFFDWLSKHMKADGLPPLMLIVGDPGKYAFYLEQID